MTAPDILGAERLALFVIKVLAVGGGYMLGNLLTRGVVWGLDRWLFRHKSPDPLKKAARIAGGVAMAVLVALIVFGSGGGGLFGGGPGEGKGQSSDSTSPATSETMAKSGPVIVTVPKSDRPAEDRVFVTVLGGEDVRDERFYVVDEDRTPKTFAELKAAVAGKRGDGMKKVVVEIRFPPRNAVARDHPAVTRVVRWANEEAGLDVTFPAGK